MAAVAAAVPVAAATAVPAADSPVAVVAVVAVPVAATSAVAAASASAATNAARAMAAASALTPARMKLVVVAAVVNIIKSKKRFYNFLFVINILYLDNFLLILLVLSGLCLNSRTTTVLVSKIVSITPVTYHL